MSSQLITIQITQNVIDALSGETIITPEKIVKQIGQIYDKDSNYIFQINENITIPTGKTLKGFENIVVNDVIIFNQGTIKNCTITLNDSSKFYNGTDDEGNINGCNITLGDDSEFYNSSYILNNCIFINGSAKLYNFYNYKDNGKTKTNYGTLKDNCIFADDTSIIQNSYDNTPGVFNNTYLRFSGSSNIDITEYQSLQAGLFTLGKTIMSYLNKQFSELKKNNN